LICSPLCVRMLWLWLMLSHHGVHLQCRCDFQLASFDPSFEMRCCGGPHFSCCGWWVGFACDHWWLFLLLWLLCLGHMHFGLLCCLSGLCLSCGVSKLNWWNLVFSLQREFASLVEFDTCCVPPWVQWEYGLLHWETSCLGYYLLEFRTWCLPPIWLGLRGSWCFGVYIV
jgi:hypothetical protein